MSTTIKILLVITVDIFDNEDSPVFEFREVTQEGADDIARRMRTSVNDNIETLRVIGDDTLGLVQIRVAD